MKKTLEKSGRTEDDAIKAALEELGLERDDVSVEILERAKSGFLGIGAVHAMVRVTYDAPDESEAKPAKAEARPAEVKKSVSQEQRKPAPQEQRRPTPEKSLQAREPYPPASAPLPAKMLTRCAAS